VSYLHQKYANIGHELYVELFEPLVPYLKNKALVIVPGGVLGNLPFDALLASQAEQYDVFDRHDYLVRSYQISYAYSATLLREMKEGGRKKGRFLGFAPSYRGDTLNVRSDPWRAILGKLRFNRDEVIAIQKIMGGDIFLDTAATEARFLEKAPAAGIIHLATHAKANDRNSDYSYLAFYQIQDSLENELVFVKNLYNLRIRAALVVLSACETGVGELQRGEGVISLARGFSYSGAASIVTTLWSIDDGASAEIMVSFYRYLKKRLPKDEALRNAKLDYLNRKKNTNLSHPLFWAAFTPVGDMSPVKTGYGWWAYALLTVSLLGFLYWQPWRK
jgi:CHAT domain-containing protein